MEKFNFNHSLKNIPLPTKLQYQKKMVSKVESFVSRLRWKLFAIQNPGMQQKITYGFNTSNAPPQMKELKAFEEDLFALVKNIQYRPVYNSFQTNLSKKIQDIHSAKEVIVKADKTANLYAIPVKEYERLLVQNVTAEYKKSTPGEIHNVNKEAAKIAEKLEIADRIDTFIESDAFITIKDHKLSFPGKVECRLLNPAKSNLGKVSKQILESLVAALKLKTKSNQWNNSGDVIDWFKALKNKKTLHFFKFDVVAFYPSISEKLFEETISWCKQLIPVSDENQAIIMNSRKSFLFYKSEPWVKKENSRFDVTMGSFDGAEVCELVGLYILHKLEDVIEQMHIGLYRDDGLAVIQGSGPQIERLRKDVFQIFKTMGLKVTIESNIKSTDFLDIFFDLSSNTYKPFQKEKQRPLYINKNSNHPLKIKKELPNMIANRLSKLSCSEQVFNTESILYQDGLKEAGFSEKMKYLETPNSNKTPDKKRTKRSRKVIWFNPPFSQTVKTNVGKRFLALVDKHFKETSLGKYFNRSTVKVSYSCMPNIDIIVSSHNKRILSQVTTPENKKPDCNCRGGLASCPLNGKCQYKEIVYKAEIQTSSSTSNYLGLASNAFKERFLNHKLSFNHKKYETNTCLSKHVWNLKDEGQKYKISWSVAGRAKPYSPVSKSCMLCNLEKTLILTSNHNNLLNKRSELLNKCRHRDKFLLYKFKT